MRLLIALVALGACNMKTAHVEVAAGPASEVCIHDVALFDGEDLVAHRDVRFANGRVASVGAAADNAAGCIDGRGKTLLPGLTDMHTHISGMGQPPWRFRLLSPKKALGAFLYAGVTTILVAQHGKSEYGLAEDVKNGSTLGPRMFLAGRGLTAKDGHPVPFMRAVLPWPFGALAGVFIPQAPDMKTMEEKVDEEAELHPTFYKLFFDDLPYGSPRLGELIMRAAVKRAREKGMRPVVHVGSASDMVTAVDAGADLLMHTAYRDELQPEQVAQIAASHVPVVTTMSTWGAGLEKNQGKITPLEQATVEAEIMASFKQEPEDQIWTRNWVRNFAIQGLDQREQVGKNLLALREAAVPIFPGTDCSVGGVIPGASMHIELATLVHLGFTPLELLRASTSRAARFLAGEHADFGSLRQGFVADALLVNGDPLQSIEALSQIETVYLGGRALVRKKWDAD